MRSLTASRAARHSGWSPRITGVRPETGQLGHRGDDQVVLELAAAAALDGAGHEVAPDEVEGRRPATDPDTCALAEALEIVLVAHGVLVVLGDVARQVQA